MYCRSPLLIADHHIECSLQFATPQSIPKWRGTMKPTTECSGSSLVAIRSLSEISRSANGRANVSSGPPVAIIVLHGHDLILWLGNLGKRAEQCEIANTYFSATFIEEWGPWPQGSQYIGCHVVEAALWPSGQNIGRDFRSVQVWEKIHEEKFGDLWGEQRRKGKKFPKSPANTKMITFLAIDLVSHKTED